MPRIKFHPYWRREARSWTNGRWRLPVVVVFVVAPVIVKRQQASKSLSDGRMGWMLRVVVGRYSEAVIDDAARLQFMDFV